MIGKKNGYNKRIKFGTICVRTNFGPLDTFSAVAEYLLI